MAGNRSEVLAAGKWLAERRAELGASAMLVARMATLLANRQGDPVKIFQQQISDIENAAGDKGPRTLRPWFRYVRAAFDSGLIADALGLPEAPSSDVPTGDQTYFIQDKAGEIVGRLVLFGRPTVR